MARSAERVTILACDGRDSAHSAARLEVLRRLAPDASLRQVKDLCTGSRALSAGLREHVGDFVVLLPCASHQGHRRAALLRERVNEWSDAPSHVVIIDPADLRADDATQWTKLAAVAASSAALVGAASARIFNGGTPVAPGVSRRAILTGRLREHRPAPRLAGERCTASPPCQLCVDACPTSALVIDQGAPTVNPRGCDGCGACVLACPQDVLEINTMPRHVWESFVQHALVGAREVGLPLGLWWACDDAGDPPNPLPPGTAWLRLRVACVRALTPAWILQPLSRAAVQVTVTSCTAAGGEWSPDSSLPKLLAELTASLPSVASSSEIILREPAGTVDALAGFPPSTSAFIASDRAPLGTISCADQSCTACSLCAERCPTGALTTTERPASWTLSFVHARCVACGGCVTSCPEQALTLRRGVEPAELRTTRQLVSTNLQRCVVCGARLASATLTARLAAVGIQAPEDGRCGDCRTAGRKASRSA
jgi:ferredoxin